MMERAEASTPFIGDSGMAARMRAYSWTSTPLGAPEAWPVALRTLLGVMLGSEQPMFITWGAERTLLYNDGYAAILGGKHPAALGRPFLDVWAEIADDLRPLLGQIDSGRSVSMSDLPLTMERNGYPEETYFTFSYTPVLGEDGRVAGLFCPCLETTAQVLAERRNVAERERLQQLFAQAPGFMALLSGPDHRFELANAAYDRLIGHRDLLGRTVAEALPETVDQGFVTLLDEVYRTGAPYATSGAKYVLNAGGGGPPIARSVDFVFQPVTDAAGRVTGIFVEGVDTTERAEAEAALRESEERFRNMADHAPMMMWVTDPDGACTYLNRRWYEFTGQIEAEALGLGWTDATHPDDKALSEETFLAANASKEPFQVEYRLRRADGAYRWAIDAAAPRFGPGGEFLGYVGSVIDIDERREAEERLRRSETLARDLIAQQSSTLSQLAEGVIVTDVEGRIRLVNEAAARLHGVARLDVPPDEYSDTYSLWTEDGQPYPSRDLPLARAVRGETVLEARWRIRRPEGDEVLAVGNAQPVLDASGRQIGAVLTLRDDTARVAAEVALRESEARLRALTDNLPSGMVYQIATGSTGQERRFLYVSRSHERLTGIPAEAVLADASIAYGLILPDDRPAFAAAEAEAIRDLKPFDIEGRFRRADTGEVRWARFISAPRPLPDGGLIWDGIQIDVTDRRLAEEKLRESEAHYRNAAELNPQVAWTANPDGLLDRVAERWREWTGTSGLGATWGEGLHADDLGHSTKAWLRSVATGEPYDIEHRVKRTTGEYRWARSRAFPRRDAAGEIVKWYGATEDIHERKAAETRLRESEARFQAIADSIDQMVWSTRPDGFHDYYNQRWYEYTGVPPGSTDGEAWNGMFHPDDQGRAWSAWQRSLATGEPYRIEYRLRHRSGQYRWVLGVAQAVRDEAGRISRWFGTCTDIQEIVDAREVLARSREELERAVAERTAERDRLWTISGDLLGIANHAGYFESVNPAWEAVLGWTAVEVCATPITDFVHPEDRNQTEAAMERLARGETVTRLENRYRTKDGTYRWLSWTSVPEGGLKYTTARDITAEKEAAEALTRTEEQLRQAQKMEAVGQLTGGIAHDFNNLLTGVIGSLDMMQRRIAQGRTGEIERYTTAAMTSANRAAALTHRLLAFSRRQPLDPKPVNANRLVTGMEELLRRTIGEAVRLEIVTAGGLWLTLCDPHQLESAILNLAINGRDAMPDGGALTIETCNAHLDQAYVAASREVRPGQYVCVCVTDTGTGMSPDVLAKAFEPFFTTKPIGQGTGLGLSMIYGFAQQSEGYAKLYSEVGKGTTVKLYLPRYYGETESGEEAIPTLTEAHRAEHGETVLVVEDETAVRDLVVDVLGELGYRAVEAADGLAGLKLLQSDLRVDLLVTDVGLPGLNGRQLADAARASRPKLKVLFMTGYAENATIANGFLEPGMQMITKPFAVESLATRIRDMIERD